MNEIERAEKIQLEFLTDDLFNAGQQITHLAFRIAQKGDKPSEDRLRWLIHHAESILTLCEKMRRLT